MPFSFFIVVSLGTRCYLFVFLVRATSFIQVWLMVVFRSSSVCDIARFERESYFESIVITVNINTYISTNETSLITCYVTINEKWRKIRQSKRIRQKMVEAILRFTWNKIEAGVSLKREREKGEEDVPFHSHSILINNEFNCFSLTDQNKRRFAYSRASRKPNGRWRKSSSGERISRDMAPLSPFCCSFSFDFLVYRRALLALAKRPLLFSRITKDTR